MPFSNPETVTISTVAQTLPKVSSGITSAVYEKDDGTVKLTVSHAYGRRSRRLVRLDFSKIAADPLLSINQEYSMSCQFIVDEPKTGFTNAEAKAVADALVAYLSASTGAKITLLLNGES